MPILLQASAEPGFPLGIDEILAFKYSILLCDARILLSQSAFVLGSPSPVVVFLNKSAYSFGILGFLRLIRLILHLD